MDSALRPAPPSNSDSPERISLVFVAALNAGELEAATSFFSRDACLITPGATAIHGREEIRSLLAQMIARNSRIEIAFSTVLRAGEVALLRQRWTIRSEGAEGARYDQNLNPTLVLRQIEGVWKLAIAMPWG
jgi:uncharacterized protein (TIGR02246 family)